jgi:dTDP-4-amino-4,6-dideoxygalactose transaminase
MTAAESSEAVPAAPVPFLDMIRVNAEFREDLENALRAVFDHGRFVGGPEVELFETTFARYCGTDYAVGVGNGTDALELILAALGIGHGDEVLVPTNTFVATAEAVIAVGARPRFVDVLPDTLLIDPEAAAAAVTSRTVAIMVVHLFGQVADMDRLLPTAQRHGLAVIEDAAQAHGASFDGRRAGSIGTAAAFSFYPGKNLGAVGDGGAVVSPDPSLIHKVRRLADHGRAANERHRHEARGRNSRLDSLQAAVLLTKLRSLDAANERRCALVARYHARLPAAVRPVLQHPKSRSVHHLAVVQVDDRSAVIRRLDEARIGWGIHYPTPCHRQPAFANHAEGGFPVAERAANRILSLPMFPTMTSLEVDRVCAVLALNGGAVRC